MKSDPNLIDLMKLIVAIALVSLGVRRSFTKRFTLTIFRLDANDWRAGQCGETFQQRLRCSLPLLAKMSVLNIFIKSNDEWCMASGDRVCCFSPVHFHNSFGQLFILAYSQFRPITHVHLFRIYCKPCYFVPSISDHPWWDRSFNNNEQRKLFLQRKVEI